MVRQRQLCHDDASAQAAKAVAKALIEAALLRATP
jgi:hypothetical protein